MSDFSYLIKHHLIPKEEMDRVFEESYSASAEISPEFMCFEEPYQYVARVADKDSIIIDLGCAYAPQSYYFTQCKRYIGVDLSMPAPCGGYEQYPELVPETRFKPDNAEFYIMSIQQFIKKVCPTLNIDKSKVIAICSAVPDKKARNMAAKYFPIHYISYPGEKSDITLPVPKKTLEEALSLDTAYQQNGKTPILSRLLDAEDVHYIDRADDDTTGLTSLSYELPLAAYPRRCHFVISHPQLSEVYHHPAVSLRLTVSCPYFINMLKVSKLTLDVIRNRDNKSIMSSPILLQNGVDYTTDDIKKLIDLSREHDRQDELTTDSIELD